MSTALALSVIMAQHAEERAAIPLPKIVTHGVRVTEVPQGSPYTLTAPAFLKAMRIAGKRVNQNGKAYTDPSKVREDSIAAIHAYCGYDKTRLFGEQDAAARTKAQRELGVGNPSVKAMTKFEEHRANRTLKGWVHGMPDDQARHVQHMLARETLAASEMVRHQKDSEDMTRPQQDRDISAGMVEFERDRLTHIRAELIKIGVAYGNVTSEGK
jgi:hypothetical protein